jgi:lipoprotein-anchoring transpeptidase ErfK/SrfK
MILQYPAANRTVNPKGDPTRVDSNGPAPTGTFPIQSPVLDPSPAISYGPVFYPIGAVGPNGERQDIARQRGIGLHGGRDSYLYPTHGCIRMNNGDISNLYNQTQHAPLQTITIGD